MRMESIKIDSLYSLYSLHSLCSLCSLKAGTDYDRLWTDYGQTILIV